MDIFKVGDCVYDTGFHIEGKIVEIKGNVAYVEFKTDRGGGCMPFELTELIHVKWCITTSNLCNDGIVYLGWQNPAWDEDGYFWTSREVIEEISSNNTPEHPFLFNSRRAAIKHLKAINIPQKCRIVRWL